MTGADEMMRTKRIERMSEKTRMISASLLFFALLSTGFDALALTTHNTEFVATRQVNVLAYVRSRIGPPIDPLDDKIPAYDRRAQFGSWVRQDASMPCADTRAEVLSRDADPKVPLNWKQSWGCLVESGLWHDPYTGSDITRAEGLQVDHVVPLRNAYFSGAHAWRSAKRCHYLNFVGNVFHLMSVDAHENMSKGDNAPDEYLPPNRSFRCRYVSAWMKIKTIWKLSTTKAEVDAIEDVLKSENCSKSVTTITFNELTRQRMLASRPIAGCVRFEEQGEDAFRQKPSVPATTF